MRAPADSPQADPHAALPLIRRLLASYGRSHWQGYAIAFVLMAIAAACTGAAAYLVGEVVNQTYLHRNYAAIAALSFAAMAIFVVKGAATYGQAVILARIANRIVADSQRRLFDKLIGERMAFFAARHSSEFIARLNVGAAATSQVLNLLITAAGRDLMSVIALGAVMVYQDPLMALIGLAVVPPALIVLRQLVRRVRSAARSQFVGGARVLETLQEMIHGMRVVKAFSLEEEMRRRAEANIAEVEQVSNRMARIANRSSPLMETLGGIAAAFVILYGGYRIIETGAPPGAFVSFLAAFLLAYEPAKRLARLNIDLNSAIVAVRALFEVIDAPSAPEDRPGARPLSIAKARVAFNNVSFSYRPGEPVLQEISFVAEPGQMTALVGPSGGGKSTTLALILRFYDPQSGAIAIDGQDIADVSVESLRRQIAYVGQDVFLFRGSIGENIAFGKPGATEAEVRAAAEAAFAHDFIMAFPQGYATPVGEHGMQLSGGQRQRIAVARALIKNAPLILLDEATAALDSESERAVQQAIARLCEGRTTIVIAHRLSTIMHADRILVIENGQVTEAGRHDELLAKDGRYAAFHRLQRQSGGGPGEFQRGD